jgi:hypothetical protein
MNLLVYVDFLHTYQIQYFSLHVQDFLPTAVTNLLVRVQFGNLEAEFFFYSIARIRAISPFEIFMWSVKFTARTSPKNGSLPQ